jgi:hypothetical protein
MEPFVQKQKRVVFFARIVYNIWAGIKARQMRAIGYAGGRALYGRAP